MTDSRKTLIIIAAAVVVLLAIYSGWKAFGGSPPPDAARNTNMGRITTRSSIMGPDASGKPRTQMPEDGQPTQAPAGTSPMDRMQGPSGQSR